MLPSQAFHRPDRPSAAAVCLAGGVPTPEGAARHGERGAVLVHVAVAMMGLLAFSALTIDLGTLWVARSQAQNAADAAALAGGISLAANPDPSVAEAAARAVAQQHAIWGEAVAPGIVTVTAGTCPTGSPSTTGECLNVAVERGGGAGSPLPVFFSRLFTAAPAVLRASASAKAMSGNTSSCVRPIAIMDSWQPATGTWAYSDRFAPPDEYRAPTASDPGTGRTTSSLHVELHLGRGEVQGAPIPPAGNEYFNLDISRPGSLNGTGSLAERGDRYVANMAGCNGTPVMIGESVAYWDADHETTTTAAESLIASDPDAYWDGTAIRGSRFQVSPRLLTIAVVDPDVYVTQQPLALPDRRYAIRNLVGFFLERTHSSVPGLEFPLVGVMLMNGGSFSATADSVAPESSFLKHVALVR